MEARKSTSIKNAEGNKKRTQKDRSQSCARDGTGMEEAGDESPGNAGKGGYSTLLTAQHGAYLVWAVYPDMAHGFALEAALEGGHGVSPLE